MVLHTWHTLLAMPKHDTAWHDADLADELAEYRQAHTLLHKWSEASDVVYTYTRACWSGHDEVKFPLSGMAYHLGILYMVPKYSLRYAFFRSAGHRVRRGVDLREVRNPRKTHKLHQIAEKYGLDPVEFQHACERQLKYWPLLP